MIRKSYLYFQDSLIAGDCPGHTHTHILATGQWNEWAQRLWVWLVTIPGQYLKEKHRDLEIPEKIKRSGKGCSSQSLRRPLPGKWMGICVCSFVPGQINISLEPSNLFLIILWITPHTNPVFAYLRRPSLRPKEAWWSNTGEPGNSWLVGSSHLLPLPAGKGWSKCSTVFGLLQPGAISFGHSWFLSKLHSPSTPN